MEQWKADRFMEWLRTTQALELKSNGELADLLVEHIWADLPLAAPQSDLIAEVIARLKGER